MTRTARLGDLIDIEKGKKAEQVSARPASGLVRYLQIDDLRPDATRKYVQGIPGNPGDTVKDSWPEKR